MLNIFSPIKIGSITLKNRIFMAPLTRLRADQDNETVNDLMKTYYAQRVSSGLIIAEATNISPTAIGYSGSPGIYTEQQIQEWQKITQAVHEQKGHISLQCWHTGRVSHTSLQPNKKNPLAPSAIVAQLNTSLHDEQGKVIRVPCSIPREMTTAEIKKTIYDFGQAAKNAKKAEFDFIEIHAAHGYLIQQFLSPKTNTRTDEYGGSPENRQRFLIEIIDAMTLEWDSNHIGIRISPIVETNDVKVDWTEWEDYIDLIKIIDKKRLAYLHLSELNDKSPQNYTDEIRQQIRNTYHGSIIVAGGYTKDNANRLIQENLIDAVAFGQLYIANPDLVNRLEKNTFLNEPNKEYFYEGGAKGYTDYPSL